jgi:hypothetical protein
MYCHWKLTGEGGKREDGKIRGPLSKFIPFSLGLLPTNTKNIFVKLFIDNVICVSWSVSQSVKHLLYFILSFLVLNVNSLKNGKSLCSAVQTIEKKSGLLADDEITPPLRFPPAEVWIKSGKNFYFLRLFIFQINVFTKF